MSRANRANTIAGVLVLGVLVALAALWAHSLLSPDIAMADGPSPHLTTDATTDSCAACHRTHTGQNDNYFKTTTESDLCLSCHDGTGASSNVAAEYSDINVPADDPATASYYAHRLDTSQTHISAQVDEFAGTLNRHSACSDCHNPHTVNNALPQETTGGWTASGALNSGTGVNAGMGWQYPVTFEYQLCLKCHSRYTVLLSSSTPTYNKTDKAAELDPTNASYHPVEAAGKNNTPAMQASLDGGKLWRLTIGSTIRCTMCHGNYRLLGNPPALGTPAPDARLAPHTSRYRSLLIANYRDRDLKTNTEIYNSNDFSLCYLCHSEAPFATASDLPRTDTNFRLHGKHLTTVAGAGGGDPSTDINFPNAGQGNAICSECHFETHSTKLAQWPGNQSYSRGVNFAPSVLPIPGELEPAWSVSNRSCALVCHGVDHYDEAY